MQQSSLVSICIPTYNAVKYIEETILCFLNQSYQNIEIIIQDDFSTDGTWELVSKLFGNLHKVRLYQNEKNIGIGPNWNAAYEQAIGEYIVIANADDIHYAKFIENGLNQFQIKGVDFVTFKYFVLFDSSRERKLTPENSYFKSGFVNNAFENVFYKNPFHIVFTIFKKDKLDAIKRKNGLFLNTQVCDFELMLHYSKNYNLYYDNTIIGEYRIHSENNSSKMNAELKSYVYDVLPAWHKEVKSRNSTRYLLKSRAQLFQYIKDVTLFRTKLETGLLVKLLKYAF